ncbi:mitochondrial ribosomal protein L46 isoform X2 [Calliopsis andreniformis]|uniref:mitochondrial ribosomal protein L46 isoform X2 n=1 Tax=Calliopsis andreniformis TaxID=337506 RepID=UPI003FCE047B
MLFKTILTLCIPSNSTFFLTSATPLTKVIFRTLSQHNVETIKKWDVLSAVCLERHPVITKPMQDIESRYQDVLQQIEFENSLMSDFEIQMKEEKTERKENRTLPMNSKVDTVAHQSLQDFKDFSEQELMKFKFAPRINEAEDNKLTSLNRKLDKHLTLLIEQQIGHSNFWIPPQSQRKDGETMIQAAQRTVQELCGDNIKIKFYGNAPIGFYQFKYPKDVQDKGQNGAKIFYFLAKYISGDVIPGIQHRWLDREELRKAVHPNVHKSLSQFLIPD